MADLNFIATLDIDQLKENADRAKQSIAELGRHAEKEGSYIKSLIQHIGKGYDVSTIEGKMNALRNTITENSLTLRQWGDNVKLWSDQASQAFAKGDFALFDILNKDIAQTQSDMKDLEAETEYLTQLLTKMEESVGKTAQGNGETARLFYVSEKDFNRVKEIQQEIDTLKGKLANAGSDTEFTKINSQIIDLENELDNCNTRASEAASALGDNLGRRAAEAASEFYTLNKAVEEQQKAYDSLYSELEKVEQKMKAAEKAGNADALKDAQLEYQRLSQQVQNTGNALDNLRARQQDAQTRWQQVSREIRGHDNVMVKMLGGYQNYSAIMSQLPGPVKNVVSGLQGMTGAAKAFIATPLGAIIAAIVLVLQAMKTALTSSVGGQMQLARATGYLQGVLGQLKEVVIKVGQFLIKMFTQPKQAITDLWNSIKNTLMKGMETLGNAAKELGGILKAAITFDWDGVQKHAKNLGDIFANVFNKAKDAVTDYVDSVHQAGLEMAKIAEERKNLEISESKWQATKATLEGKEQEARMRMMDTSLSAEERQKALKEYEGLINRITGQELAFINQKIALQKREMALTTNNIDKENELRDLEAERARVQADRSRQMAMLQRQRNSVRNSENSEEKAAQKAAEEALKVLREQQQEEINLMVEGRAKKLRQIDLDYDKQMDAIAKRERELKERNEKEGRSGKLTDEQNAELEKSRSLAEQARQKRINDTLSDLQNFYDRQKKLEENYQTERAALVAAGATEEQLALFDQKHAADQKALFNELLGDYQTYEQKRTDISQKYAEARERLYQHNEDGTRKKDADGNDVFQEGVGPSNVALVNHAEQDEINSAINDYGDQVYRALQGKTLEALKTMLNEARKSLKALKKSPDAHTPEVQEQIKKAEAEIDALQKRVDEAASKKVADVLGVTPKELESIKQGCQDLGGAFSNLGDAIGGATGGVLSFVGEAVTSVGNTITTVTEGVEKVGAATSTSLKAVEAASVVLAVISTAISLIKKLNSILKSSKAEKQAEEAAEAARKYKDEIESLTRAYDRLGRAIDKAYGKDKAKLIQDQIDLLEKRLRVEKSNSEPKRKRYQELLDKKNNWDSLSWWEQHGFSWKDHIAERFTDEDKEELEKLEQELRESGSSIEEIYEQMAELRERAVDAIFGEDVQSAIERFADALTNAWEQGKDASESAKDFINNMIRQMIKQALLSAIENSDMMRQLRGMLQAWIKTIDFGLSTAPSLVFRGVERAINEPSFQSVLRQYSSLTLDGIYSFGEQMAAELNGFGDLYRNFFSDSASSRSAASKGIAQASQESIDELNGRATVIQGHTFSISETTKLMQQNTAAILGSVRQIEGYTQHLIRMDNDLHRLQQSFDGIVSTNGIKIRTA